MPEALFEPSWSRKAFPLHRVARNGFTLVELLVVIGIIVLLISMLLPSLNKAQQQAKTVECMDNLRQIGICYAAYVVDNRGQGLLTSFNDNPIPPASTYDNFWFASVEITGNVEGWNQPGYSSGYLAPYFQGTRVLDCPALTDEPNDSIIGTGLPFRVAYAYNTDVPTTTKHQNFSLIENPTDTMALYDGAYFLQGIYSACYGANLPASKQPEFQGRHQGGLGNVLWYDGHVTSETPYICHLSSSYASIFAPYASEYVAAHIGMLVPFTASQYPESTLVFSSTYGNAKPINMNYYFWYNKDVPK